MTTKIEVAIKGTKKDGYIIKVSNKGDKFNSDIAVTAEELETLFKTLKRYYASKK